MLGPIRSRASDQAAVGGTNSATQSICAIVDSYAQICDENRWKEIANVYDVRGSYELRPDEILVD